MMLAIFFSGVLALAGFGAAEGAGQPPPDSRIDPTPGAVGTIDRSDAVTAARVMNVYGRCVARNNERRARQVLAMPLRSDAQHQAIGRIAGGDCLGANDATIRFGPSLLVGAMAEFFLVERLRGVDLASIKGLTDRQIAERGLTPRTAHEDVATCLAAREPEAGMTLVRAQAGSREERSAFRPIVAALGPCTPAGGTHMFNHESLRAIVAAGLYRLLAAPAPPAS